MYVECGRFPTTRIPGVYALLARRYPLLWAAIFNGTNVLVDASRVLRPFLASGLRQLVEAEQPDVVVSVLPAVNGLLAEYVAPAPLEVVLTDWHSVHRFWVAPGVSHYTVPTESARRDCVRYGAPPAAIDVLGLPVRPQFAAEAPDERHASLGALDLDPRTFTVLAMVGAEGSPGALRNISRLLRSRAFDGQLIVICGHNAALRRRVEALPRTVPLRALGFVDNVAELMRSSDLLITKAGGLTLAEAFCCGVPVVVHDLLPGQEAGNLAYTLAQHAVQYAPRPRALVETVLALEAHPEDRAALAQRGRALARPQAAAEIARAILARAHPPAA